MNPILVSLMSDVLKLIKDDKCVMSQEQEDMLIQLLGHTPMNKEQASLYLHMSRAKFDREIRSGRIPKGRKVAGSSSLVWYKDELTNLSN